MGHPEPSRTPRGCIRLGREGLSSRSASRSEDCNTWRTSLHAQPTLPVVCLGLACCSLVVVRSEPPALSPDGPGPSADPIPPIPLDRGIRTGPGRRIASDRIGPGGCHELRTRQSWQSHAAVAGLASGALGSRRRRRAVARAARPRGRPFTATCPARSLVLRPRTASSGWHDVPAARRAFVFWSLYHAFGGARGLVVGQVLAAGIGFGALAWGTRRESSSGTTLAVCGIVLVGALPAAVVTDVSLFSLAAFFPGCGSRYSESEAPTRRAPPRLARGAAARGLGQLCTAAYLSGCGARLGCYSWS